VSGTEMTAPTMNLPGSSKKPLVVALVVIAVLAALAIGYFVITPMLAGSDTVALPPIPSHKVVASPSATPKAKKPPQPLSTFDTTSSRDPFAPLLAPPVADATPSPSPSSSTLGPAATTTSASNTNPQAVQLIALDSKANGGKGSVLLRVDANLHDAKTGDVMNGVLKVASIDTKSSKVTLLYGDQTVVLTTARPALSLR
jgi:hypothetical protein